MHIKHKWDKWENVTLIMSPGAISKLLDITKDYKIDGQVRTCLKCGKIKTRARIY